MSETERDPEFEALLDLLKRERGFDFTGYKRTTLLRRTQKRMDEVGLDSFARYVDLLRATPGEFARLFDTLLINVTRFFRDDGPWQFLTEEIIPALLAKRGDGSPIRIWSAGCASGEEAYTLAMILAEAIGIESFRARVKIYATDADEDALATARSAVYSAKQMEDVPDALREKYFETVDGRYQFTRELRRSVIFGRNDLVQDSPISRIDLLVCRNTLMYFDAATQAAILSRFHFALVDGGVLFLGRAETLLTQNNAFSPVDLKRRIFSKVQRYVARDRLMIASSLTVESASEQTLGKLRESAFEAGAQAQIVVDRLGHVMLANELARQLFGLTPGDVGRPLQDLELSYRPVELRSLIDRCYADRRRVFVGDVVWRPSTSREDHWFTVEVTPLAGLREVPLGVSVVFSDTSAAKRLQQELEESKQNLETAYEELQSTNEELETTNEELQSTVEELETTNEELQSTNEELETMNEELQSTIQELQTINDELRHRSEELNELNAFLEAVFTSLRGGVVVIDRDSRVLVWNSRSEELWGVRAAEVVGSSILTLDAGLPLEQLTALIRGVLSGQHAFVEVTIAAVNRRGRQFECLVSCTPLLAKEGAIHGVIIVMGEVSE